jgi:hypothetical protein
VRQFLPPHAAPIVTPPPPPAPAAPPTAAAPPHLHQTLWSSARCDKVMLPQLSLGLMCATTIRRLHVAGCIEHA